MEKKRCLKINIAGKEVIEIGKIKIYDLVKKIS
jgi:hypothetical protein